jgi:hypothetical protein
LAFVNHFFSWVTAEALTETRGIVDKYIGDEVMIVFSGEFGSVDPFAEAVSVARRFGENDAFSFRPHIGIASGRVAVGYVGTPVKYNCSVFGHAVAVAARCAAVRVRKISIGGSIVFPAKELMGHEFDELFPRGKVTLPDGTVQLRQPSWEMSEPRTEHPKNMPPVEVIVVESTTAWIPTITAEEWAKRSVRQLAGNDR